MGKNMPAGSLPLFSNLLDPKLERHFTPLCTEVPVTDIERLRRDVNAHLQVVRQALTANEFLDWSTAQRIAEVVLRLLDEYGQHTDNQRALIVGATRYFVRDQDVEPDLASLLGFDDDVIVLNHVLDSIGRSDWRIELNG
jgi:uncharacterized membrane protein YkvA (DUF1232 family)